MPEGPGQPLWGLPPVVENVLVAAQEGPLGARHQQAYDVVADAGESLHLGLGDEVVARRCVPVCRGVWWRRGCAGRLLSASLDDGVLA